MSKAAHIPPEVRAAAELELRRRYAEPRNSLYGFIKATKPDMMFGWYHRLLCRKLDQFLVDVQEGKQPRLMVIAPPRHGKSEIVSRRFPAYAFGRNPRFQLIACSYASDLAQRMNRDVQRVIEGQDDPVTGAVAYNKIFPNTSLNAKNIATISGSPLRNSNIFEIVGALGAYRAAGVGQGITGMGFDIGIIDDPVKDQEEANSELIREGHWEWYQSTFYTRRSPLSGILLIMTRWHEADLGGKLLYSAKYEGGDQWDVVRFPAIAEEDEYDTAVSGAEPVFLRKEGEALHPERFPLTALEQTRKVQGTYHFAALYQGRPVPKGGGIVKPEDFRYYRKAELEKLLSHRVFDLVVMTTDAAFKDTDTSSFVVTQVWGRRGVEHFLLAQSRKRLSFIATIKEIRDMRRAWPNANALLIEDKANGPAIIEVLSREIPGVIAIEPLGSKEARAEAAAPLIEAHNVWLPHPDEEPWSELFVHEWCAVPTGAFWDQVDASGQYLLKYGRTLSIRPGDIQVGAAVAARAANSATQGMQEVVDSITEGFM